MEIFNIGIPEILFLLVIMLIVLGPKDMAANARKLAVWIRKLSQSETWQMARGVVKEVQSLPKQLVSEAGLEEWEKSINPNYTGPQPYMTPQARAAQRPSDVQEPDPGQPIEPPIEGQHASSPHPRTDPEA